MNLVTGHFTEDNHIHNSSWLSFISLHLQQRYHKWGPSEKSHCIVSAPMVGPIIYLNNVQTQDFLYSINCLYVYTTCSSSYVQWWTCRWHAVKNLSYHICHQCLTPRTLIEHLITTVKLYCYACTALYYFMQWGTFFGTFVYFIHKGHSPPLKQMASLITSIWAIVW